MLAKWPNFHLSFQGLLWNKNRKERTVIADYGIFFNLMMGRYKISWFVLSKQVNIRLGNANLVDLMILLVVVMVVVVSACRF